MKLITVLLGAFAISHVSAVSKSWAGSNLYFIQGLDDSQQNVYLDNLKNGGAKVARVWVNKQSANCDKGVNVKKNIPDLESTPGIFNPATLDALDQVLVKLAARGMKALISPHDANLLQGSNGNDGYGQWYGSGNFYSDTNAMRYYDARLSYIMNYKGKYSGQVWKTWTKAIMGFDIQNEPMASKKSVCQGNDAANWMCGRAQHMRNVLGGRNPIKIATGGIGGDISQGCTFIPKAMQCGQIDLVAVHAYKGNQANNQNQWSNSINGWLSSTNGKLLMIEEFGTPSTVSPSQGQDFSAQTADLNKAGVPWTYWQILPPRECSNVGSDTFGIWQGSDTNGRISAALTGAANAPGRQDWTGITYWVSVGLGTRPMDDVVAVVCKTIGRNKASSVSGFAWNWESQSITKWLDCETKQVAVS